MNVVERARVVWAEADPSYVTVQAVASHFGVSKMTVYRMIDAGEIEGAIRVGRRIVVPVDTLDKIEDAGRIQPGDLSSWAYPGSAA